MSVLDGFIRDKREQVDITLLPALGNEPAFVVTANLVNDRKRRDLANQYMRFGQLDESRYGPKWIRQTLDGWVGLTVENVVRMLADQYDVDVDRLRAKFGDREIPYSIEFALTFYQKCPRKFQDVINERIDEENRERQRLIDEKVQEEKKHFEPGPVSVSA